MEKEKIVTLDSHVLFWLITNPRKISPRAKVAIAGANKVVIPIITLFEIFWLLEKEDALRSAYAKTIW